MRRKANIICRKAGTGVGQGADIKSSVRFLKMKDTAHGYEQLSI